MENRCRRVAEQQWPVHSRQNGQTIEDEPLRPVLPLVYTARSDRELTNDQTNSIGTVVAKLTDIDGTARQPCDIVWDISRIADSVELAHGNRIGPAVAQNQSGNAAPPIANVRGCN